MKINEYEVVEKVKMDLPTLEALEVFTYSNAIIKTFDVSNTPTELNSIVGVWGRVSGLYLNYKFYIYNDIYFVTDSFRELFSNYFLSLKYISFFAVHESNGIRELTVIPAEYTMFKQLYSNES